MKVNLISADIDSKVVIQNMARFYAYEMSKYCGFDGVYDWSFPEDGLYEANDFSRYWQQPGCYPFVIRIENKHESELGGFALINKEGNSQEVDWNMGEFFIVGKFQKKGIGRQVALQIFNQFPGIWEIGQMIDNVPAIRFWKHVVNDYTQGNFLEDRKTILKPIPHEGIILKFKTV